MRTELDNIDNKEYQHWFHQQNIILLIFVSELAKMHEMPIKVPSISLIMGRCWMRLGKRKKNIYNTL